MSQIVVSYNELPADNEFIDSAFVLLDHIQKGDIELLRSQWNSTKAEVSEFEELASLLNGLNPTDTVYTEFDGNTWLK